MPWNDSTGNDPLNFDGLDGLNGDRGGWSTPVPEPGVSLPPFRPSLSLQRTRFAIDLHDASTATVDVDHLSGRASLYRNDKHVQTSDMPIRFPLGSDSIEVAASRYGMQRIRLICADGSQRRLDPAPGTPEHWRAQLSRRHPGFGRALAVGAVIVLTINLIVLAPQLLELVTHLPLWADRFVSFASPVDLPAGVNIALTLTAGLAGIERALTFRHHRLLDVETDGIEA
ncbi:hypothetical protein [Brevibacterium sp. UCMA 11754]|uniref:hypothetical protein n=1 Tax=Brevibacterium sp. UCMA 11754 TaxID=2749198 RepID=UPI001F32C6AF|nr:hypothetical protein [Brevibacterium sp. UCMA 11754]MCF2573816.1 hypothetical protein [Brevibacterium sp. UCMA 11754]